MFKVIAFVFMVIACVCAAPKPEPKPDVFYSSPYVSAPLTSAVYSREYFGNSAPYVAAAYPYAYSGAYSYASPYAYSSYYL